MGVGVHRKPCPVLKTDTGSESVIVVLTRDVPNRVRSFFSRSPVSFFSSHRPSGFDHKVNVRHYLWTRRSTKRKRVQPVGTLWLTWNTGWRTCRDPRYMSYPLLSPLGHVIDWTTGVEPNLHVRGWDNISSPGSLKSINVREVYETGRPVYSSRWVPKQDLTSGLIHSVVSKFFFVSSSLYPFYFVGDFVFKRIVSRNTVYGLI